MDVDASTVKEVGRMPLGLRLAVIFLQFLRVATFLLLLFACVPLVMWVIVSPFTDAPLTVAFAFCFASLGGFLLLLEMVLGTSWLEHHLNRRPFAFAPQWKAPAPGHPLRLLALPALRVIAVYGLVSVCVWIASCFERDGSKTWLWPVVWATVGTAAFVLSRYLERILPR